VSATADARSQARAMVLRAFGADAGVLSELLAYDADGLGQMASEPPARFPLADEPFVETWRGYRDEAAASGFAVLADRLVQLQFPIAEGISATADYQSATRRGVSRPGRAVGGLMLERPGDCRIVIHATWAGSIPLIQVGCRADFVALVRAFSARNEPAPVPDSMGAAIIAGYNNWGRFRALREHWIREHPDTSFSFERAAQEKASYQDRFILLSDGWYSNVPSGRLGLSDSEWRRLSLIIRREHECAHYWTRRVLSSMRNRLLDEIIADYCGICSACGTFRADWLLTFFGIDGDSGITGGGRLHNYRGDPPLSDAAFAVVRRVMRAAAANLEQFDSCHAELRGDMGRLVALLTLSTMSLEELAQAGAPDLLAAALRRSVTWLDGRVGMTANA
jgi:Family of unknown function (DUF7005)